jgi:hypothetical protein
MPRFPDDIFFRGIDMDAIFEHVFAHIGCVHDRPPCENGKARNTRAKSSDGFLVGPEAVQI